MYIHTNRHCALSALERLHLILFKLNNKYLYFKYINTSTNLIYFI